MPALLRTTQTIVFAAVGFSISVGPATAQDVELEGVLRDFKPFNVPGGHPDMEAPDPSDPLKKYIAFLAEPVLGENGRPEFGTAGWEELYTGVSSDILDVHFVGLFQGWAVGMGGTILHTTDAGKTWKAQTSPVAAILTAIYMLDLDNGWAVSWGGHILATNNGGQNWALQGQTTYPLLDVKVMAGGMVGMAVGWNGAYAKTDNGGVTWSNEIIRSDGAGGWERVAAAAAPPAGPHLLGIEIVNDDNAYAVGAGTIVRTTTGGVTWETPPTVPALAGLTLTDVDFPSDSIGYAVGTGGSILKTINGGSAWFTQGSPTGVQLTAVHFAHYPWVGNAITANGHMLRTLDGGANWVMEPVSPGDPLRGLHFPTDSYGFVVGDNGLARRYDPPAQIVQWAWNTPSNERMAQTMFIAGTDDIGVALGPSGIGSIDSALSFDSWYKNVPGYNLAKPLTITLKRMGDGSLVFKSSTDAPYQAMGGFFAADGMAWGNSPGLPHNHGFTVEFHAAFTYDEASNPLIETRSDDDLWIFVDGNLVIACAGVHWGQYQWARLSRLGLKDGEVYPIDIFYAERQANEAILELKFSFDAWNVGRPEYDFPHD